MDGTKRSLKMQILTDAFSLDRNQDFMHGLGPATFTENIRVRDNKENAGHEQDGVTLIKASDYV